MIKALMVAVLGMMVHLQGVDPCLEQMRLTFGVENLEGGLGTVRRMRTSFSLAELCRIYIV